MPVVRLASSTSPRSAWRRDDWHRYPGIDVTTRIGHATSGVAGAARRLLGQPPRLGVSIQPHRLRAFAGLVWILVGAMLVGRSVPMMLAAIDQSGLVAVITTMVLGSALGAVKGRYVLSRTARRSRRRIEALETARIWQLFTAKTWLLVAGMIGLGVLLRAGAANDLYPWAPVAALYAGIGAAMAISSAAYFVKVPPPIVTRVEELPPASPRRPGVLVVNLGTPDDPTVTAVRRYLREFLDDPRVVEVPRWLWFLVLRGIILPLRARRSAQAYRRVWGPSGSPLLVNSQAFSAALSARLGPQWEVRLAMRYGNPSLAAGLAAMREAGCKEVTVASLFPQSSNTTTGTVQAEVARLASLRRDAPALRFVGPLYDDAGYIGALAERVREATADRPADFHVFSFHGIPESYVRGGDPYLSQCTATAAALARALALDRDRWEMVFQSRFGDEPWLQPYAAEFVPALAGRFRRVAITMPAFAADCLETIDEIGVELAAAFRAAGGEELVVVPALNDHPSWVEAIARRVEALGGGACSAAQLGLEQRAGR